ncbi:MAG: antitoxin component YwqK of YwqJK toxin-antitoxin module [Planctomycetota bacterium]|jgi:antitoxin component YwqK of YwqJK toxin-antitoxin module
MPIRIFTLILGVIGLIAAGTSFSEGVLANDARVSHYGNGQAKESTFFIDGLREGPTTRWYSDGTLRAVGSFDSGKMVGEWTWNTPDGQRDQDRSGVYQNGVRIQGLAG